MILREHRSICQPLQTHSYYDYINTTSTIGTLLKLCCDIDNREQMFQPIFQLMLKLNSMLNCFNNEKINDVEYIYKFNIISMLALSRYNITMYGTSGDA